MLPNNQSALINDDQVIYLNLISANNSKLFKIPTQRLNKHANLLDKIDDTNWLHNLIQTLAYYDQTNDAAFWREQINTHFNFTTPAIYWETLKIMYGRLTHQFDDILTPLNDDIAKSIVINIKTDIKSCTPGARERVYQVAQSIQTSVQYIDDCLYLGYLKLLEQTASEYIQEHPNIIYDRHHYSQVLLIAHYMGFQNDKAPDRIVYSRLQRDDQLTIKHQLGQKLNESFQYYNWPSIILEQFIANNLIYKGYCGYLNEGSYDLGDYQNFLKSLAQLLGKDNDEAITKPQLGQNLVYQESVDDYDIPTYEVVDINWQFIRQWLFDKLINDGFILNPEPDYGQINDDTYNNNKAVCYLLALAINHPSKLTGYLSQLASHEVLSGVLHKALTEAMYNASQDFSLIIHNINNAISDARLLNNALLDLEVTKLPASKLRTVLEVLYNNFHDKQPGSFTFKDWLTQNDNKQLFSLILNNWEQTHRFLAQHLDTAFNVEVLIRLQHNGLASSIWHIAFEYYDESVLKNLLDSSYNLPNLNVKDNEGETVLHRAIRDNNSVALQTLLSGTSDQRSLFTAMNDNGQTPLHLAVQLNHASALDTLITYDIDVNIKNTQQYTCLELALLGGLPNIAQKLLYMGADITNITNIARLEHFDQNSLHYLANHNYAELIDWINDNTLCEQRNKHGETPILLAAKHNNIQAFDKLIGKGRGIDLSIPDNQGYNVVYYCVLHGNLERFQQVLLQHNHGEITRLLNNTPNLGQKPLLLAYAQDDVRFIDELYRFNLLNCIDPLDWLKLSSTANYHQPFASWLIQHNRLTILQTILARLDGPSIGKLLTQMPNVNTTGEPAVVTLLSRGLHGLLNNLSNQTLTELDEQIQQSQLKTSLAALVARCSQQIDEQTLLNLINNIPSYSTCSIQGINSDAFILFEATMNYACGGVVIKQCLAKQPELINKRDPSGQTALHKAVIASNIDGVATLLAQQADISIPDNRGKTPLAIAQEGGQLNIINLLLDYKTNMPVIDINSIDPYLLAPNAATRYAEQNLPNNTPTANAIDHDSDQKKWLLSNWFTCLALFKPDNLPHYCARLMNEPELSSIMAISLLYINRYYSPKLYSIIDALMTSPQTSNTQLPLLLLRYCAKHNDLRVFESVMKHVNPFLLSQPLNNNGDTILHWVAQLGHIELLHMILQNHKEQINVNQLNKAKKTPLHTVVTHTHNQSKNNAMAMITLLLNHNAQCRQRDQNGQNALTEAILNTDPELPFTIINEAQTPLTIQLELINNHMTSTAKAFFHQAFYRGYSQFLSNCLDNQPFVAPNIWASVLSQNGQLISHAAAQCQADTAADMIRYVNRIDRSIRSGLSSMFTTSLFHQADHYRYLPLHYISMNTAKGADLLQTLIDIGVPLNINVRDCEKNTPVHYATMYNGEIAQKLIQQGAAINSQNTYGFTPLHYAAYHGQTDVVTQLLAMPNIDYNARDKLNHLPALFYACRAGHYEIVQSFYHNAPQTLNAIEPFYQETAIHQAARYGHANMIDLFYEYNPQLLHKANTQGINGAHIAAQQGYRDVFERFKHYAPETLQVMTTSPRNILWFIPTEPTHNQQPLAIIQEHKRAILEQLLNQPTLVTGEHSYAEPFDHDAIILQLLNHSIINKQLHACWAILEYLDNSLFAPNINENWTYQITRLLDQALNLPSEHTAIELIQYGANTNIIAQRAHKDQQGNQAVHYLAKYNYAHLLNFLMTHKPIYTQYEAGNRHGQTPLLVAAQYNSEDVLQTLLQASINLTATDYHNRNVLHYLIKNHNTYGIDNVLTKLTPNQCQKLLYDADSTNRTLVETALGFSNISFFDILTQRDLIKFVTDRNFDIKNPKTPQGEPLLTWLYHHNRFDTIRSILDNVSTNKASELLLQHQGAKHLSLLSHFINDGGHSFITSLNAELLNQINQKLLAYSNHTTSLAHSLVSCQLPETTETVGSLLKRQHQGDILTNLFLQTKKDGKLPLHDAILNKHQGAFITSLLVQAMPDTVWHHDHHGDTPLHIAARVGNQDCAEAILELSESPQALLHIRNNVGEKPGDLVSADHNQLKALFNPELSINNNNPQSTPSYNQHGLFTPESLSTNSTALTTYDDAPQGVKPNQAAISRP